MKLNRWVALLGTAAVLNGSLAQADETSGGEIDRVEVLKARLEELDQKVKILERKDEVAEEAAEAKKKTTPIITISDKGFQFQSADKNFSLKLRGLLQVDTRTYIDDGGIDNNDSFLIRRARPIIEGTFWKDFDYYFTPEFAGSSVSVLDSYLNYTYQPWLQVRAGKFKSPVGLEQLQSDPYRLFAENSLVSNLVPNRDIGIQIHGSAWEDLAQYAFGVFNGVRDGGNANNIDFDDEKEIAGRLFIHPFKKTDINELKGFGIGLGGSYGVKGNGPDGLTSGYLTDGQQTFFRYSGAFNQAALVAATPAGFNRQTTALNFAPVVADGKHWRLSPQGYYYYGPFGFLGELAISTQDVRRDASLVNTITRNAGGNQIGLVNSFTNAGNGLSRSTLSNVAWQVAASYVLTGEDASFRGVTPKKPFSFSEGTWGAFEIAARYSELNVDDGAFAFYADPLNNTIFGNALASQASAWGVGLNWYLNRNLRATLDYFNTDFKGGGGAVSKQDESVVITRLQLLY